MTNETDVWIALSFSVEKMTDAFVSMGRAIGNDAERADREIRAINPRDDLRVSMLRSCAGHRRRQQHRQRHDWSVATTSLTR